MRYTLLVLALMVLSSCASAPKKEINQGSYERQNKAAADAHKNFN